MSCLLGSLLGGKGADWTPAQRFAWSLGAPYHIQHQLPPDALPGFNPLLRNNIVQMCKRDWSVESAEDLLRVLNWLGREGHRVPHRDRIRRYSLIYRPTVAARREELRGFGEKDPGALKELFRLDAVQSDWNGIRGGVLLGFDTARAAMLARCGLLIGWLSEEATWSYLLAMAADVQRSFGSWSEYAADYRLSRALWAGNAEPDMFDDIVDRLLKDERGPWRKPWPVEGLGLPRPVVAVREDAPLWVLER